MPIYNAYDYLRPAMDSVIDQTLREIEIICIDDGSTDHSLEIIKEYQKSDSRIRIITENNAGPSIARNKGLLRSRGEFVIFLDADDFYELTLIEKLYSAAVEGELDIAFSKYDIYNSKKAIFEPGVRSDRAEIFDGNKIVSKQTHPNEIFQSVSGYVWNKMFRRSFLVDRGLLFNEEIRVFEDNYFVVTAMALADRVGRVNECLVHHRIYSQQSKNKLFKKYYKQVPKLYADIKEFLMANGMYIPLSHSFLNLSASRCCKIYNILWRDAKEELWNILHEKYAELLGWTNIEPEDIESEEARNFVTNVLVFTHEQYQRRLKRGKAKVKGGVERAVKDAKARKKLKGLFTLLRLRKGKKKEKE